MGMGTAELLPTLFSYYFLSIVVQIPSTHYFISESEHPFFYLTLPETTLNYTM